MILCVNVPALQHKRPHLGGKIKWVPTYTQYKNLGVWGRGSQGPWLTAGSSASFESLSASSGVDGTLDYEREQYEWAVQVSNAWKHDVQSPPHAVQF